MKRYNVYLTDRQKEQIDAMARIMGIRCAEMLRKLIDAGMDSDRINRDLGRAAEKAGRT